MKKAQMEKVQVIVVMGSKSDLPVMKEATKLLEDWDVKVSTEILSAHRTPQLLASGMEKWQRDGILVVIAGAGGAAHLPGMLASFGAIPVIGVPVKTRAMNGLDSLLSIAQMPKGVPVATVAVDNAYNAGLLALQILAIRENQEGKRIKKQLERYKKNLNKKVIADRKKLMRDGVPRFLRELT